jgi:hypothetical protein
MPENKTRRPGAATSAIVWSLAAARSARVGRGVMTVRWPPLGGRGGALGTN